MFCLFLFQSSPISIRIGILEQTRQPPKTNKTSILFHLSPSNPFQTTFSPHIHHRLKFPPSLISQPPSPKPSTLLANMSEPQHPDPQLNTSPSQTRTKEEITCALHHAETILARLAAMQPSVEAMNVRSQYEVWKVKHSMLRRQAGLRKELQTQHQEFYESSERYDINQQEQGREVTSKADAHKTAIKQPNPLFHAHAQHGNMKTGGHRHEYTTHHTHIPAQQAQQEATENPAEPRKNTINQPNPRLHTHTQHAKTATKQPNPRSHTPTQAIPHAPSPPHRLPRPHIPFAECCPYPAMYSATTRVCNSPPSPPLVSHPPPPLPPRACSAATASAAPVATVPDIAAVPADAVTETGCLGSGVVRSEEDSGWMCVPVWRDVEEDVEEEGDEEEGESSDFLYEVGGEEVGSEGGSESESGEEEGWEIL
ncbi:hypothetical protein EJ05DRAFT_516246 [Pseudovirgaria hyperparasitica]|uniref:Uncharacterized protein n=1 Tax=Pseudovirgaria hyperparasitica TaxID=470096 RepID=A0A6A6WKT5_9PEZI|nr:uncharacterized protein EJ05DRAFT_516246 [Pseudovirgaria hyperparasitica]KAF2762798.1 hypothetical protein EJ05DRAFT_516246 [Pseudovirgaria hyperparasitica]